MILLIDNYDSFTWNLVQRFGEIAPDLPVEVVRNDSIGCACLSEPAAGRSARPGSTDGWARAAA